MRTWIVSTTLCTLLTSGCQTVKPVPFEDAMKSLGQGFVNMYQVTKLENGKRLSTGMIPIEAQVSFNVTSTVDKNGNIKLAVSPIPVGSTPIEGSAEAGYAMAHKNTAQNTITVSFRTALVGKTTIEEKTEKITGEVKEITTKKTVQENSVDPKNMLAFYEALAKIEKDDGNPFTPLLKGVEEGTIVIDDETKRNIMKLLEVQKDGNAK